MIEIITPRNRHLYHNVIESMFRLRYRIFVEEWGWKIPGLTGRRDCDAFDTEHSIYLVECDPKTRAAIACARLIPTVRPHLFSETFPHLCDLNAVPRGERIYEASRYALDRTQLGARDLFAIKGRLEWAVTWYSLRNGIDHVTWLMSKEVYARNIQLWDTTPLGLPVHFEDDDRTYIPAISKIDEPALIRIAARYNLSDAAPLCIQKESVGRSEVFLHECDQPTTARPAA